MTQEELAQKANIGIATLVRIEQLKVQPRPKTAKALARALGVEPSALLEDD